MKIKTQILCSLVFFNRVFYETTWKSILEPGRSQMTVRLICISYWINKATDIICNMYCFCTAEMVARTHVTIKLYAHCQVSFFFLIICFMTLHWTYFRYWNETLCLHLVYLMTNFQFRRIRLQIKGMVLWVKNWDGRRREQYWLILRYTNNIFLGKKRKS